MRKTEALLSAHHATRLGNFHHVGGRYLVSNMRRAIANLGRVALFAGSNGEVVAYSYRHPDFDRHCRVHAGSLVGVYQSSGENTAPTRADLAAIEDDLMLHIAAMLGRKARAA